jgi:hypothetical protein
MTYKKETLSQKIAQSGMSREVGFYLFRLFVDEDEIVLHWHSGTAR